MTHAHIAAVRKATADVLAADATLVAAFKMKLVPEKLDVERMSNFSTCSIVFFFFLKVLVLGHKSLLLAAKQTGLQAKIKYLELRISEILDETIPSKCFFYPLASTGTFFTLKIIRFESW